MEDLIQEYLAIQEFYLSTTSLHRESNLHLLHSCIIFDNHYYFGVGKCERSYAEMSISPKVVLMVHKDDRLLKISGKVTFSSSKEIATKCFNESNYLQKLFPNDPNMIIAFCFEEATVELFELYQIEPIQTFKLNHIHTGIHIKKDNEIKERLLKLQEERVAMNSDDYSQNQKEIDGTLLYLLECAKQIWKRMDITPIEFVLLYNTYDEREEYIEKAKQRLGNKTIQFVEDITDCFIDM